MNASSPAASGRKWKPYPAYKDSGVEWLGKIPAHWQVGRLKHAAALNMGQSPDSDDCNIEGYGVPFLQGCAEFGPSFPTPRQYCTCARKLASPFDVLLSVRAPVGELNVADRKYGIGRGLCAITGRLISSHFLMPILEVTRCHLSAIAAGSTFDAVSVGQVGDLRICLPPSGEQAAITKSLDHETARVDALVAKKERLIELLEEKRAALISHAVTEGLNPNATMKDSGIPSVGKVPAHWDVKRNKTVYRELDERSVTGQEELLTVSHITGVTPRSEKDVGMFMAESMVGYKKCQKGDLAINTMWAWMGALGISRHDGIVSPSYNVYHPKSCYVSEYLDYLYRTPAYICEINRFSTGVWESRLRLYPEAFLDMYTLTPPLAEQQRIVEHLALTFKRVDRFIAKLSESIEKLKEFRTALIAAAVTGKIDVRETTSKIPAQGEGTA